MRQLRLALSMDKKRTLIGALFCLVLCPISALAAPAATLTNEQAAAYEGADETARVQLLLQLAKSGQHETAAMLLERYPLAGEHAANRTLFIKGLILRGRGDLKGAAALYRDALADDPSLTLVRQELAQTLVLMGENDSAKHQLNRLIADAPTEEEVQGVRAFIDTLDARTPWKFSTYISAAPSTNVNNGSTSNKLVYVDDGNIIGIGEGFEDGVATGGTLGPNDNSRAKSGIGMAVGGNAGFTKQLDRKFLFVLGLGADGRVYDDKEFNSLATSQSAELRYLINNGTIGAGLVSSQSLRTDAIGWSYYSFGPRVSVFKQLSAQDRASATAIYELRRYVDVPNANGYAFMVDADWQHAFSADLAVTVSASYDRISEPELDYKSFHSYGAGLSIYKELPYGFTADLRGDYRFAHFDSLLPNYNKKHRDHQAAGAVRLTKRDWDIWGYAPALDYTYVRNFSNINLYDFDSHTVELTLTKDF
jgi:outer membrane protein